MRRVTRPVVISAIYLAIVMSTYFLHLTTVLNILTLPWSYPLMLFSGLIFHATVTGEEQIALLEIAGAFLNVIIFLFWKLRNER